MGIFSRKQAAPVAAAPAPAKRKRKLTGTEFISAIEAACADRAADGSTFQTLERLRDAANIDANDVVTEFDDSVSVADLDAAIADMQDASPSTLSSLKRARAILAGENLAKRSEPVQHVTVAQLKARDAALLDALSWALGAMAAELNNSHPTQAHVFQLLGRSADSPERKNLLEGIRKFRETDVPRMSQAEWLRYQSRGPGR
jgi:hypothetical protein